MNFEIISDIIHIEPIAIGNANRDLARLRGVMAQVIGGGSRGLPPLASPMLGYELPNYIGMRPMASARKKSNANAMWIEPMKEHPHSLPRFVVCLNNTDYPASLELHKIYRVLPDEDAAKDGDLRVIDESGEDYLYPADLFALIDVPKAVERALLQTP